MLIDQIPTLPDFQKSKFTETLDIYWVHGFLMKLFQESQQAIEVVIHFPR